jgi:release factor glutamine methyltransferase
VKWQEYIHQHAASLHPLFEISEANFILKSIAEHIQQVSYSEAKDISVSKAYLMKAGALISQVKEGKPLQYVLEEAWFYKYPFKVNASVLIPRPETEELVEWVISYIDKERDPQYAPEMLDIGTGSGCIPITLKKERPAVQVSAIDISQQALATARENAVVHNVKIELIALDFLDERSWADLKKYDIIISNPPYIPINELETLAVNVRNYEPHLALFVPEKKPLLFYEKIAAFGKTHLKKNGVIFLELHKDFAQETKHLFEQKGYREVIIRKDISGNERMLRVQL